MVYIVLLLRNQVRADYICTLLSTVAHLYIVQYDFGFHYRERLLKEIADRMAADGYLEAGYEYLVIDDCWLAEDRDSDGKLQPDPKRFPSGLKSLGDYVTAPVTF